MSVSVESNVDGVTITYARGSTVVEVYASDLRTAIERIVSRFGEMQEDSIEALAKVGVRVRTETTEAKESLS